MSISETIRDIAEESKLEHPEKVSLTKIAKAIDKLQADNERLKEKVGILELAEDLTKYTKDQLQENKRLRELLEMAASQLRYIGCFSGCDNGVLRDSSGEPCQCQCCAEQAQIEQALKEQGKGSEVER